MTDLTYEYYDGPEKPFRKGDIVTVTDRGGMDLGDVKIAKVTRRHVTTDCGRQWTLQGWYQGERQAWPFPTIRSKSEQ